MVKTADALAQVAKSLEANTEMLKTMKDTMQDATMSGEEMIKVQKATIGLKTKSKSQLLAQEHEEKQARRLMTVATRGQHPAFGLLSGIAGQKFEGASRLSDLQRMENQGIDLSDEQRKTKSQLIEQGADKSKFKPMFDIFNKHFGEGSKWDKMFGGHGKTAAMGLGMGAVGGGMALGKMIIDSSPMFQQMLKLLNFGIMMILRPIGDFFGFMMRPILIALLQKFIIPFYQTYLPLMQKLGTDIGERVVDFLNWIQQGIAVLSRVFKTESAAVAGVIAEGDADLIKKLQETDKSTKDDAMVKAAGMNTYEKNLDDIGSMMGSKVDGISMGSVGNWQGVIEKFGHIDEVANSFKGIDTAGYDVFSKTGELLFRNLPLMQDAIDYYENKLGYDVKKRGEETKSETLKQMEHEQFWSGQHLATAPDPFMNIGGMENKNKEPAPVVNVNFNGDVVDEYKMEKKIEDTVEKVLARRFRS